MNAMPASVKKSLKLAEMICPGAYAARDEVIEAAQEGAITVTCAGTPDHRNANPERLSLTAAFWKSAEIEDSSAGWMADFAPRVVARPVDRPEKEYDMLRVEGDKAKVRWPAASTLVRKEPHDEATSTAPISRPLPQLKPSRDTIAGGGNREYPDDDLVREVQDAVKAGRAKSFLAAASSIQARIPGGGTADSRIKRIAGKARAAAGPRTAS